MMLVLIIRTLKNGHKEVEQMVVSGLRLSSNTELMQVTTSSLVLNFSLFRFFFISYVVQIEDPIDTLCTIDLQCYYVESFYRTKRLERDVMVSGKSRVKFILHAQSLVKLLG